MALKIYVSLQPHDIQLYIHTYVSDNTVTLLNASCYTATYTYMHYMHDAINTYVYYTVLLLKCYTEMFTVQTINSMIMMIRSKNCEKQIHS